MEIIKFIVRCTLKYSFRFTIDCTVKSIINCSLKYIFFFTFLYILFCLKWNIGYVFKCHIECPFKFNFLLNHFGHSFALTSAAPWASSSATELLQRQTQLFWDLLLHLRWLFKMNCMAHFQVHLLVHHQVHH